MRNAIIEGKRSIDSSEVAVPDDRIRLAASTIVAIAMATKGEQEACRRFASAQSYIVEF